MKEKKARVEDAMHATRAAVEEGIVPGGGVALIRCVTALDKLKVEGDEQIGVNIVKRALQEPLRWIAENAGKEGTIVLGKLNESKDNHFVYNALTGEYEDLVKAGVLDPYQGRAYSPDQCRLDCGTDADPRKPSSPTLRKRRRELPLPVATA